MSLQLAELGLPMVIALNMMDMIEKQGDKLDASMLATLLGIRVVPISAAKGKDIHKLIHAAEHELEHTGNSSHVDRHSVPSNHGAIYTGKLKTTVELTEKIIEEPCRRAEMPLRWSAVKLIEGDEPLLKTLALTNDQLAEFEKLIKDLETEDVDREMIVADQKYKYINKITRQILKKAKADGELTVSDKIDNIITNKFLALPLFAGIMALIFYITFGALGSNLVDTVDALINVRFLEFMRNALEGFGTAPWAVGLICDGMITGIGAVLSFFPQIALLFLFLSILEDSGYMARAAFIMDRALHGIGLSGKSFVPMLMGFGCSVPAIMATRTLPNERDRRLTIMMVPFMSCSAKMPIYMLFISVFFARYAWLAVSSLYLLGILVGIIYSLILQKTVLRGGHAPFMMELPPYRLPTVKTLGIHLWEKIKDFLTKAGTILLGASILIWFMQYFNFSLQHVENSRDSILGIIGSVIAPVFTPLGFGDWKSTMAVLSGLIAKESTVSTLAILYNTGREGLFSVLRSMYTPASAYAMMAFSLLSVPCAAAIAAIHREMNSLKWTFATIAFQTLTAWMVTLIIYQVGRLIMAL